MTKRIPHDRLFKELLGTFLYEFLELFLPELARRLEPGSLHLMNKELFPEGETERRVDLVAQAQLRDEEESLNLPGPQSRLIAQFFDSYLQLDPDEEERYRHEFDKISPEELPRSPESC